MTVSLMRRKSGLTMIQTAELIEQLRQGSLSNDDYRWEAAARIEKLEAALHWVSLQHYTDQRTVTPEIAHQAYRPLIAHVNAICDKARAALEERT